MKVWLAQCLGESNESLLDRGFVESSKAEEQRIWIGTFQTASIDTDDLNTPGFRPQFRLS